MICVCVCNTTGFNQTWTARRILWTRLPAGPLGRRGLEEFAKRIENPREVNSESLASCTSLPGLCFMFHPGYVHLWIMLLAVPQQACTGMLEADAAGPVKGLSSKQPKLRENITQARQNSPSNILKPSISLPKHTSIHIKPEIC